MKALRTVSVLLALSYFSCSKPIAPHPQQLFREFWEYVDKNYIFFEAKKVDWSEVYIRYSRQITANTTEQELFDSMDAALYELKDGHNRLVRPNKVGRSFEITEGYDVHFDATVVKKHYVRDSLRQSGNLYWGMLKSGQGYIYLPQFSNYSAFGSVLKKLKELGAKSVVIDVRNNLGGDSNAVPQLLGILVKQKTYLGAYIEKNGPNHKDITVPMGIYAAPHSGFYLDTPVIVLINRSSYSATSYFAAMIKGLPNVKLIGQTTGGGAGGNLAYQLSNGWIVTVSVSDFIDKEGHSIEEGVEPDLYINNTAEGLVEGHDAMLECAMGQRF